MSALWGEDALLQTLGGAWTPKPQALTRAQGSIAQAEVLPRLTGEGRAPVSHLPPSSSRLHFVWSRRKAQGTRGPSRFGCWACADFASQLGSLCLAPA